MREEEIQPREMYHYCPECGQLLAEDKEEAERILRAG